MRLSPAPWTPTLSALRERVEATCAALPPVGEHVRFNSVLLNYSRDGSDSMGFHADDEPELGPNPLIASASLGSARRFLLKPSRRRAETPDVELALGRASLLVMGGTTQHNYRHGVPKQRAVGARINLTFRRIVGTR